jgi:protein ImuB
MERAPAQEQKALQSLARWCYQFTSAVSVEAPDKLLLELQGSLTLFGGLHALLLCIQQGIHAQGYSLATGLASTPKAASLMSYSKVQASDYINSSGRGLAPEKFTTLLNALPVSTLNTSEQIIAKLCRTGFESLNDVLHLPYAAAGKRYGKAFVLYLQQVLGEVSDPQSTIHLPESFTESLHFMQGITETEALLFPMQRLLSLLCTYLRIRQLHCTTFTCLFEHQSGQGGTQIQTLKLGFAQPQNNLKHFMVLLGIKLENFKITAPVESITLQANRLCKAEQASATLFPGFDLAADDNTLRLLFDKLSARLGTNAMYGLCMQDSHIPEYAWQTRPDLNPAARHKKPVPYQVKTSQRPIWFLNKPLPLQCRHHQLYWHGKLELIEDTERVEGNWWHKPVQRDYFVARREDGTCCWIFQDRLTRHWFIQGLFG